MATYKYVGLAHPAPFGLLSDLFSKFAYCDHVGVCWDLCADLVQSEWDPPQWLLGQLRDLLLDLRRHLRGEALRPDRWTAQLVAGDARIGDLAFVQKALSQLGVGDDDPAASTAAPATSTPAAPTSLLPAASPLAFNSTHAVFRLQQLLLSGSATALHFERAIKHADPQRSRATHTDICTAPTRTRAHPLPRAFLW